MAGCARIYPGGLRAGYSWRKVDQVILVDCSLSCDGRLFVVGDFFWNLMIFALKEFKFVCRMKIDIYYAKKLKSNKD